MPTEAKVASRTSQSKSGISVDLSDSGNPLFLVATVTLKSETLGTRPEARNPDPETRILNPKIQDLQLEIRMPTLGASGHEGSLNPKPFTLNPQPEIRNPLP